MNTQPQNDFASTKLTFEQAQQAEIIAAQDNYYYRYESVLLDISRDEFERTRENPHLYYFSTSLKLKVRAQRLLALQQAIAEQSAQACAPKDDAPLPYQYTIETDKAKYDLVRLRIRHNPNDPHWRQQGLDLLNHSGQNFAFEPTDATNYWAEVIRSEQHFFYRIDQTVVDITKDDYCRVIQNPILYYLSTALYLHHRIARINQVKASLG